MLLPPMLLESMEVIESVAEDCADDESELAVEIPSEDPLAAEEEELKEGFAEEVEEPEVLEEPEADDPESVMEEEGLLEPVRVVAEEPKGWEPVEVPETMPEPDLVTAPG